MSSREVTYKRLVNARAAVARYIEEYGEVYWPIFDRLDRECAEYERRSKRLQKAKELACEHEPYH